MVTTAEIKKLRRLTERVRTAQAVSEAFRAELATRCDHPKDLVTNYQWEHDTGYGRQLQINGYKCGICLKIDLWRDGTWRGRKDLLKGE
jgi:hypothetical protein